MRQCVRCQHFFTKDIENKIRNTTSLLTWNQWINNGHHSTKSDFTSTVQQCVPDLQAVRFFSDGAASQFKQRYLFRNLTYLAKAFNVLVSWHFFASHHGKGVVDGLGATVKRLVHQQILTSKDCRNAPDFVLLARS